MLKIEPPLSTSIFHPSLIRCSIEEVPLADAPPYHALSYTWKEDEIINLVRLGRHIFNPFTRLSISKWWKAFVQGRPERPSPFPRLEKTVNYLSDMTITDEPTEEGEKNNLPQRLILCDRQAVLVTQNLHNALSALSRRYPGYWWIDQLCINQDNVQERSAQVALMGHLYRGASQVIVWLGERTRLEARALAALEQMATMPDDVDEMIDILASLFSHRVPRLAGLLCFFSRSWFDRLWVVQEFAVANRATFLLGDIEIPLHTAAQAMRRIEKVLSAMSFAMVQDITDIRSGLLDSREYTTANGVWSLEKWLCVARGRKTTDPRDYVFGGLSLLGKDADQPVQDISTEAIFVPRNETTALGTDYSKSVGDVYFAFSLALFSSELGPNALSLVGTKRDLKQFPSWMVNLHHPLSPKPLHQLKVRRPRIPSSESGNRPGGASAIYVAGGIAQLEAVHFDQIQAVGEPLEHWFNGIDQPTSGFHLTDTLRLCVELGTHYQHTGELSLVALWRTLILESNSDALPNLDASFAEAVRSYFDETRRATVQNLESNQNAWHDAPGERATSNEDTSIRNFVANGKDKEGTSTHDVEVQQPREAQSVAHAKLKQDLIAIVSSDEYRDTEFVKALLRAVPPTPASEPKASPPNPNTNNIEKDKGLNDPALWYKTWLAFFEAFHEAAPGRRLFITRRGYIGMAPVDAQPGDDVLLVRGAWAPYVFRRLDLSNVGSWEEGDEVRMLIGEAYLHGIMGRLGSDEEVLGVARVDGFGVVWVI